MKTNPKKTMAALEAYLPNLVFPSEVDGVAIPTELIGQPLFQKVGSFDLEDFELALQELLMFKDRIAVVVTTQQLQQTSISGFKIVTEFADDFAILVSDRSWANRQEALKGNATSAGGMTIGHILVSSIQGEFADGYVCEPRGAEVLELAPTEREEQTGRVVWRQQVRIHGGTLTKQLSRTTARTLITT